MPTRDPDQFDPTKPLVMARFATLLGHAMGHGDPIKIVDEDTEARGEVTGELATRLWASGHLDYAEDARPTPVETVEEASERLTEMEDAGDGKFLIRAPWLGEGEFVTGSDAALARYDEVVLLGHKYHTGQAVLAADTGSTVPEPPADFTIEETGSNGYFTIFGPGMTEPERVRGRANAEQRVTELRGAPPISTTEVPDPPAAE